MNILDDAINKIKKIFSRNKTKALPSGEAIVQYDEKYVVTQKTVVYSAKEALKQNWVLGEQERLKRQLAENNSNNSIKSLSYLIDSEFKYDSQLQRTCILAEQSSYISSIIESYIRAKIVTNRLAYNNITIDSEEIISFIRHLEQIDFSKKFDDDTWYLKEMEEIENGKYGLKKEIFEYYGTELNPEYREIFESLDEQQKMFFVTQRRTALELFNGLSSEQKEAFKNMSLKNLNLLVSLEPEQQQFFKQLKPEQLDILLSLDTNQLYAFMTLGEHSKSIFARKSIEDSSYFRTMINAISIYMENSQEKSNNIKYDIYKDYLATEQRKKVFRF